MKQYSKIIHVKSCDATFDMKALHFSCQGDEGRCIVAQDVNNVDVPYMHLFSEDNSM